MVIFADTFSNNFEPPLHAARRVLEAAGHRVAVAWPDLGAPALCCGRTYLATGQVDKAKAEAQRLMQALLPFVAKGVPSSASSRRACSPCATSSWRMGLGEDAQAVCDNAFLFEEFLAREKKAGRLTLDAEAAAAEGALAARPLPPEGVRRHERDAGGAGAGARARRQLIEFELLRHGRQLRLRGRALRDVDRHGRAVAAAGRAQGAAPTR